MAKRVRVSRQRRAQGRNGCTAPMPSRLCCKPVEVMIIAMVAPLGAGGREEQAGRLAVRAGKSHCWTGHRRIISASAENRGNSCQRKHPAEILALGPSCASHRRSSNTNSLCGRNSAGYRKSVRPFQRDILRRHFLSSSPPTSATQSGLFGAFIPFMRPQRRWHNGREIEAQVGINQKDVEPSRDVSAAV